MKITKISATNEIPFFTTKKQVAAYCRVSTQSNEQLISLAAQKMHYESYINSNQEWEFAGLYYEEVSGTKKESRPELNRLIKDCEMGRVDLIITKSISRFARNTTDCLELVRKLMDIGVGIYFESENINTLNMEDEFMLSVLSSLAESESVSIAENNKWSIQRRFKNGTYKLSYAPYGYKVVNGRLEIDENEAETAKFIFKETLNGKGASVIANELNAKGIPSRRGKLWRDNTIIGMLTNERYVGDVLLQKTYTDEHFNKHKNHGEVEQYLIKDTHEPLISRESFEAVQKLIQQRGIDKGNLKETYKYQNRYTMSGKIICSECGHSFKRRIHKKNANENYVAWCCKKHIENNMACSMKYIKDEDLKYAFVLMMNKLIFSHKTVLKPFIRSLGGMDCDNVKDEISRIDCRCVEISKKMQVISKLAAEGLLDGSAFNNEKNELNIEYQKLVERKKHLYDYTNEFKENIEYATTLYKFCSKSEMLNEYSDELFEKHISRVIVYSRDSVGFELKCGIVFTERLG